MSWTVEQIEKETMITLSCLSAISEKRTHKARHKAWTKMLAGLTPKGMESYTERVLFLVNEIKKLRQL